jgi:hypothetical protein
MRNLVELVFVQRTLTTHLCYTIQISDRLFTHGILTLNVQAMYTTHVLGTVDVSIDNPVDVPFLDMKFDRKAIVRFGLRSIRCRNL